MTKKNLPSNNNLEMMGMFQYNEREWILHKRIIALRIWHMVAYGPQDHDPAMKMATFFEFSVPTFNTKQYSHFPLLF